MAQVWLMLWPESNQYSRFARFGQLLVHPYSGEAPTLAAQDGVRGGGAHPGVLGMGRFGNQRVPKAGEPNVSKPPSNDEQPAAEALPNAGTNRLPTSTRTRDGLGKDVRSGPWGGGVGTPMQSHAEYGETREGAHELPSDEKAPGPHAPGPVSGLYPHTSLCKRPMSFESGPHRTSLGDVRRWPKLVRGPSFVDSTQT